eukprot:Skav231513  [mRNA]  locus=scaffold84:415204:420508:- [translate_table: standard]
MEWGTPVQLAFRSSSRSRAEAGGTAVIASVHARAARLPVPGEWRSSTRLQATRKAATPTVFIECEGATYFGGVFASTLYGAELFPVNSDVLQRLRSKTADALLGKNASSSPVIALALTGNKILDPEFVVIKNSLRTAMMWLRMQSPSMQQQFFRLAASFTGHTAAVKGPASALSVYLSKVCWQIHPDGFVSVDTFVRLYLADDSFQVFVYFLTMAWQQDLVRARTDRHSLYHHTDISRTDTIALLKTFDDSDRLILLRELAHGFQTGEQKVKWCSDEAARCPLCGELDSHRHRLFECEAFSDIRFSFQQSIDAMHDYGACFDEQLTIAVHPDTQYCNTAFFQTPDPVLPDMLQQMYADRVAAGQRLRFYTDGSCLHSATPSSRYAAFACVVDLCATDSERFEQIQRWKATGKIPDTFQTVIASRVRGMQTINRAESQAMLSVARLGPQVEICSDSQYAVALMAQSFEGYLPTSTCDANIDLRRQMLEHRVPPNHVQKIPAHQDPAALTCWRQQYHAFGNTFADEAAKLTCKTMYPTLVKVLEKRHDDLSSERTILGELLKMTVQIQKARANAMAQQSREESHADTAPQRTQATLKQQLIHWTPQDVLVIPMPVGPCQFAAGFAWGMHLIEPFFQWLARFTWPSQPGGPTGHEIGLSWLELGFSLSIELQSLLPILRTEQDGEQRILFVQDRQDMVAYNVSCADIAMAAERIFTQLQAFFPDTFVHMHRRVNVSLYTQGYMNHTTGLAVRPAFPHQDMVFDIIASTLHQKRSFGCSFAAPWVLDRVTSLTNLAWEPLWKGFRAARRVAKRQGVSPSYR